MSLIKYTHYIIHTYKQIYISSIYKCSCNFEVGIRRQTKTNRRVNELSMAALMADFLISPRLPFNQFGSQNVHVTQWASDVIFAEEKTYSLNHILNPKTIAHVDCRNSWHQLFTGTSSNVHPQFQKVSLTHWLIVHLKSTGHWSHSVKSFTSWCEHQHNIGEFLYIHQYVWKESHALLLRRKNCTNINCRHTHTHIDSHNLHVSDGF